MVRAKQPREGSTVRSGKRAYPPVASQDVDDLRTMLLMRRFEDAAAEGYSKAKIGGFLHLDNGQEAAALGTIGLLHADDYIVTHYRDHGHAIARGVEPERIMAELYGKATGVCGGKGGSMHLFDAKRNFMGGYAIVTGHLPMACGLGLAMKYQGRDSVVLCIFGDGAVNEGEWHEALNLAAVWKLPVLFFCLNNEYAMGTAIGVTSAVTNIAERSAAYGIAAARCDGMDLWDTRAAMEKATAHIRSGKGPYALEAMTYRFRGHSMADPEFYRTKQEVRERREAADPIEIVRAWLEEGGLIDAAAYDRMVAEVNQQVEECVRYAEESPDPEPGELYTDIYAGTVGTGVPGPAVDLGRGA